MVADPSSAYKEHLVTEQGFDPFHKLVAAVLGHCAMAGAQSRALLLPLLLPLPSRLSQAVGQGVAEILVWRAKIEEPLLQSGQRTGISALLPFRLSHAFLQRGGQVLLWTKNAVHSAGAFQY